MCKKRLWFPSGFALIIPFNNFVVVLDAMYSKLPSCNYSHWYLICNYPFTRVPTYMSQVRLLLF